MKRILTLSILFIFLSLQHILAQGWQWIDTGYPFAFYDMSFPPGQSNIGYAVGSNMSSGGIGIIIKTTDGGSTWLKISDDTIPGLKAVCFTSENVGYIGGYQDLLMKTTDGGLTWTTVVNEFRSIYINNIKFWDANNGVVVIFPSTVLITTDAGSTWHFASGIKQTVEDVCYADVETLYLVGADEKISKSTDGGLSWTDIYTGVPFGIFSGVHFYNPDYGMVGGENGKVLVTTDGGINWITGNAGGIGMISGIHLLDEQNAFVAGTPEQVYKTTDCGLTWVSDFNGSNTISFYKIRFTENLTGFVCCSEGKILINRDYVTPVELAVFTFSSDKNIVKLQWTTGSELDNSGFDIQRSPDCYSWEKIGFVPGQGTTSKSTDYTFTDELFKSGSYFYRLKQLDFDGNFEYSDIIDVYISIPAIFNLEQNYPNPFNPVTSIRFSVPGKYFVKLKIFDLPGNEIETLVNEEKSMGTYHINWYAAKYPSGVYLYQFQAIPLSGSGKGYLETRKMILIK